MGRSCTAERHEGELSGRRPAPGETLGKLVGHHGRRHAQGRVGRPHRSIAAFVADPVRDCVHRPARRFPVQPHAPSQKMLGVNEPDEEIAVRDCGSDAAPSVACGSGVGARALRADLEHPLGIDPEHRAAPRTDGPHVHHRHDEGIVPHPGRGGVLRLLPLVDREVAACPAEIDGEDPGPSEGTGDARRGDETGRGAGQHGVDRPFPGRVDAERPAVRGGDVDRRGYPRLGHAGLQPMQVGSHDRLHVRVHDGDESALELALLRPDRGRLGNRDPGQAVPERFRDLALRFREGVGVEQEQGHRFDAGRAQVAGEPVEIRRARTLRHAPVRANPGGRLEHEIARHEGLFLAEREIEGVVEAHAADLENPAVAAGDDEPDPRPAALDDGIDEEGRAVNEELDVVRAHPGPLDERGKPPPHRERRVARNTRLLVADDLARQRVRQHEVGERPAHVDADAATCSRLLRCHSVAPSDSAGGRLTLRAEADPFRTGPGLRGLSERVFGRRR